MSKVIRNNHPGWFAPVASRPAQLMVFNSLTESKEAFHPKTGNTVKMYICGPTVYDASHMGHARAYLTFDILRRILSDYFNYDVSLQMNITDIDDKIILKARKNELFRVYADKMKEEPNGLFQEGSRLLALQRSKIESEGRILQESLSGKFKDEREKTEAETLLKQNALKLEKITNMEISSKNSEGKVAELLELFKDLLSDSLDKELGHTIGEDKQIFESHARRCEESFFKDCEALGIRAPDVVTRVTEFVPEIVTFTEKIIENGFAYESEGSVYFDTQKFRASHDYPKLVPQAGNATAAEMIEGEGALSNAFAEDKKHKNDFALWKASKAGEPYWDSPWGQGRPGWHIECSVMASSVFGDNMDIHGGGSDLKFPHHDNELAQSEAHYGCDQWVNYFLHAGHLHIKGLKMSKSLKNFVTIQEALESYTARQIRIMFLLHQWDKPINFSDQSINEAREKENRFKSFFERVSATIRDAHQDQTLKWDDKDFALNERIMTSQEKVHSAICDNFGTPLAMEALDEIVSAVNTYLTSSNNAKPQLLNKAAQYVTKILRAFGLITDQLGFTSQNVDGGKQLGEVLDAFCALRDQLRALGATNKIKELFAISDELRDKVFVDLGVKIEDDVKKSRWALEDPAVLRRELVAKQKEKDDKKAKKVAK